jgi:hypothetical protein
MHPEWRPEKDELDESYRPVASVLSPSFGVGKAEVALADLAGSPFVSAQLRQHARWPRHHRANPEPTAVTS